MASEDGELLTEGSRRGFRHLLLFPVAVWVGTLATGGAACVMEVASGAGRPVGPAFVVGSHLFLPIGLPWVNAVFLLYMLVRLAREPAGKRAATWQLLIIGEAIFSMFGLVHMLSGGELHGSIASVAGGWVAWLALLFLACETVGCLHAWAGKRRKDGSIAREAEAPGGKRVRG